MKPTPRILELAMKLVAALFVVTGMVLFVVVCFIGPDAPFASRTVTLPISNRTSQPILLKDETRMTSVCVIPPNQTKPVSLSAGTHDGGFTDRSYRILHSQLGSALVRGDALIRVKEIVVADRQIVGVATTSPSPFRHQSQPDVDIVWDWQK